MSKSGDSFTHLDPKGNFRMVDVGSKPETKRMATACARVRTRPEVMAAIRDRRVPKGDVAALARMAGIMAAKKNIRPHTPVPFLGTRVGGGGGSPGN